MTTASDGNECAPLELDSRVTCSVCLEPLRGRRPKLLPCYHTFCLSCLEALARSSQQVSIGTSCGADVLTENKDSYLNITCPTCRKVSPVPDGGVVNFQTNFYVEDDIIQRSLQPLPCDVCDKEPEAKYSCGECQKNLCSQCLSYHSKLLPLHVSHPLASSGQVAQQTVGDDTLVQLRDQIKLLELVVTQLDHNETEVERQRQAVDDDISVRYAAGLSKMADAREECIRSLKSAVEAAREKIQMERRYIKKSQGKLSHLASLAGITKQSQSSKKEHLTGLLSEAEINGFQQRIDSCGELQFFRLRASDVDDSDWLNVFRGLMGQVTPCAEPNSVNHAFTNDTGMDLQRDLYSLDTKKYDRFMLKDTKENISCLQSLTLMQTGNGNVRNENIDVHKSIHAALTECAKLRKEVTDLQVNNSTLFSNVSLIQTKITRLNDEITDSKQSCSKLETTVAGLQTELSNQSENLNILRAGNVELRSNLKSSNDRIDSQRQQLATLNAEYKTHHTQIASLQAQTSKLTLDTAKVSPVLASVQQIQSNHKKDLGALKAEQSRLCSDSKSSSEHIISHKQELTILQSEHKTQLTQIANLQALIDKLIVDTSKLSPILTSVQQKQSNQKKDTSALKAEYCKLYNELKASNDRITSQKQKLASLQAKQAAQTSEIHSIQTQMDKMKMEASKFFPVLTSVEEIQSNHKKELSVLKTENSKLATDLTSFLGEVTKHRQELTTLQTKNKLQHTQLSALQVQIKTIGARVAFQATLDNDVKTTKMEILVFRRVYVNMGNAYNSETGMFTAPVAGTYIFFLTTDSDDSEMNAKAVLATDGSRKIGYSCAQPKTTATGHAIVQLALGQKVWSQTLDHETCKYLAALPTCFSGILVQPEV